MKPCEIMRPYVIRLRVEAACRAVCMGACVAAVLCCFGEVFVHLFFPAPVFQAPVFAAPLFLLATLIFWLIYSPSIDSAARRIDREFGLNARTETMISFADNNSVFAEMQRQDAVDALSTLSAKKIPIYVSRKPIAAAIAMAVLAAGAAFLPYGILLSGLPNRTPKSLGASGEDEMFISSVQQLAWNEKEQVLLTQDGSETMDAYIATLSELMEAYGMTAAEVEAQIKKNIEEMGMDIVSAMNAYTQLIGGLLLQPHWKPLALALLASDTDALQATVSDLEEELISYPKGIQSKVVFQCAEELQEVFLAMEEDGDFMEISYVLQDTCLQLQLIAENEDAEKSESDEAIRHVLDQTMISLYELISVKDGKKQSSDKAVDNKNPLRTDIGGLVNPGGEGGYTSWKEDGGGLFSGGKAISSFGGGGLRDEKTMGNPEYAEKILTFDPWISNPDTGDYVPYGKVFGRYYQRMAEEVSVGLIPEDVLDSINEYFGGL